MFDIIVDINRYQFLQQMTNIKFKLTIFSKYVGNFKTLSRTIKTKKKKKNEDSQSNLTRRIDSSKQDLHHSSNH